MRFAQGNPFVLRVAFLWRHGGNPICHRPTNPASVSLASPPPEGVQAKPPHRPGKVAVGRASSPRDRCMAAPRRHGMAEVLLAGSAWWRRCCRQAGSAGLRWAWACAAGARRCCCVSEASGEAAHQIRRWWRRIQGGRPYGGLRGEGGPFGRGGGTPRLQLAPWEWRRRWSAAGLVCRGR